MCRIIEESDTELIIYDHHLLREPRYLERVKKVYESAKRKRKSSNRRRIYGQETSSFAAHDLKSENEDR